MKLLRARVERFKGIRELSVDFRNGRGGMRDKLLVVGDNGSGKTTLLQAIALVLGLASRRVPSVEAFPWYGFIPERIGSLGQTRIELDVQFTQDELEATRYVFEEYARLQPEEKRRSLCTPGAETVVTLRFNRGEVTAVQGAEAKYQFLGRWYLRKIIGVRPDLREQFRRLGDVFWFDQFRNLGTAVRDQDRSDPWRDSLSDDTQLSNATWTAGVEQLRSYLVGWWSYHLTRQTRLRENGMSGLSGVDYIAQLEERMSRVFPGFKFVGTEPKPGLQTQKSEDFLVLVERDGCDVPYDIAEMSSGEQAVFPLAYEMARLEIEKSIVLIDELELHLHAPEQQALYAALSWLAPNCQFIVTTHSKYLDDVVPKEAKLRLKGGRLCL